MVRSKDKETVLVGIAHGRGRRRDRRSVGSNMLIISRLGVSLGNENEESRGRHDDVDNLIVKMQENADDKLRMLCV